MKKRKWKVTLNWKGEIHEFYTWAISPETAIRYAFARLAEKLGIRAVHAYYDGMKDNISVEEVL